MDNSLAMINFFDGFDSHDCFYPPIIYVLFKERKDEHVALFATYDYGFACSEHLRLSKLDSFYSYGLSKLRVIDGDSQTNKQE